MTTIIAVDGPSGAGKGTISRKLAEETGFSLLDSGALYRVTALAALKQGADIQDESAVVPIALNLPVIFETTIDDTKVILAGEDVSREIRTEKAGMNASIVAAFPGVRSALLQRQRAFAQEPGLVADGRDMGTVVFPQAQLKIFLTASPEERAKRRYLQLEQAGQNADMQSLIEEIRARDERDSSRATAPLTPADDAILVDSTALSIGEVNQHVFSLMKDRGLLP